MPNTKKELTELNKVLCASIHCNYDEFQDAFTIDTLLTAENLFANGVTVQKWIPVSERLPETRGDVLVCRTWWNEIQEPQIGWYNDVSGNWYILTEDGYIVRDKVILWMPLPKPPKGE